MTAIRPCNQRYVKGTFVDFPSSHSSRAGHLTCQRILKNLKSVKISGNADPAFYYN